MPIEKDIIHTPEGDISLTCIGHGTLMIEFSDKVIRILIRGPG